MICTVMEICYPWGKWRASYHCPHSRGHSMTRFGEPPVDYLRECSSTSLRYFEMSKLEHVANLRRELSVLMDEMMEESALALFARWMLEKRSLPTGPSRNGNDSKSPESRRARSLLAEFIKNARPPICSRGYGSALAGRPREDDGEAAERESAAGADCRDGDGHAKEHMPPQRGSARPERRIERRGSRASRAGSRASEAQT